MSMLFAASTGGFYRRDLHGNAVPADAVPITDAEHRAMLAGTSAGQVIVATPGGRPLLADPPPPTTEQAAAAVRAARNRLLAACDWTQMPDSPVGTAAVWVTYRQLLRDLTSQDGFPFAVEWPTPPA